MNLASIISKIRSLNTIFLCGFDRLNRTVQLYELIAYYSVIVIDIFNVKNEKAIYPRVYKSSHYGMLGAERNTVDIFRNINSMCVIQNQYFEKLSIDFVFAQNYLFCILNICILFKVYWILFYRIRLEAL